LPYCGLIPDRVMTSLRPSWQPRTVVPIVALLVLALVCFARLVAVPSGLIVDGRRPSLDHANPGEPRPVGNDLTFLFLPHHLSIARVVAQYGHVPLWDPRGFGGRPLVGNPQAGMFYPPVWAVWWSGSASSLGWLTIGHLFWGSLGVYVLMRSAAQGRWAATVAAAVYQASPFLMAQTFEGHYPHVWAACWYPWAFWCYGQARAGRVRGLLFLPLVLALTYLAGHPQEWLLLVISLSAWCLADAGMSFLGGRDHPFVCQAGPPDRPESLTDRIPSTTFPLRWSARTLQSAVRQPMIRAGVVAFSIGLAAVDVIPQLIVRPWLLQSQGGASGTAIPRRYHLELLNAFQLLSPTALGGPADYVGADNYWETVLSIGFVPLFLAMIAVFQHPDRKLVRGWLVLVALAVWFACGRHLGLYAALYYLLPGISWFRVPARSLFVANLGAAVLAGLGIQALESGMRSPWVWRRFAVRSGLILGILLAALCAIDCASASAPESRTVRAAGRVIHNKGFQITLAATAATLVLGSLRFSPHNPKLAGGLIGLLAMAELGYQGHSLIQVAPAGQFLGADPVSESLHRLRREQPSSGPLRIKARDSFYGDLRAAENRFEKTNINDVFQLEYAARLYETLYPVASRRRRVWEDPTIQKFRRKVRQAVFDRMSVEYIVSDRVERDPGWPVVADGSWQGSRFVIARNPSALPRAYVVPDATIGSNEVQLAGKRLRSELSGCFDLPTSAQIDDFNTPLMLYDSDPRATVLLSALSVPPLPSGPRQPFTPATWISTDPDHPVLAVTTELPGFLVVSDTWMPGWTATVDGVKSPIIRGNVSQRVIPLPRSGSHTIELDYWPPGFSAGCAITALSVLAWATACGFVVISRAKAARLVDQTRPSHGMPKRRSIRNRIARQRSVSTTSTNPTSMPCPPAV
jgi:hypothetical protein